MISTPNRLEEVARQVERGEPVDWNRLALLQTLDLVLAGRRCVEEAIQSQEREDERIEQLLAAAE